MTELSEYSNFGDEAQKATQIMIENVLSTVVSLEAQANRLEELFNALLNLLDGIAKDNDMLKNSIISNVNNNILPYIESLKRGRLCERQSALVDTLESNIGKLISPFAHRISSEFVDFTPTEIRVACQIKDGKTTKEIAELLCVSINTILTHRYHIRCKLGLTNKDVNLRSHLSYLENKSSDVSV